MFKREENLPQLLEFYMGKNTPDRQLFIIDHLKVEKDLLEEDPIENSLASAE